MSFFEREKTYPEFVQDRDVKFNCHPANINLCPGEIPYYTVTPIIDVKGNPKDIGSLRITNLRVIWTSLNSPSQINLSIGYANVLQITHLNSHHKTRGDNKTLIILAKQHKSKFEFVFECSLSLTSSLESSSSSRIEPTVVTGLNESVTRINSLVDVETPFVAIHSIYQSYSSTSIYRDLKIKYPLFTTTNDRPTLSLLPNEQIYEVYLGISNVSSETGNLGAFHVTNIRLVWHSQLNVAFNASIPWIQIQSIKLQDSKYGPALAVETSVLSGKYILGFRIDPKERCSEILKQVEKIWRIHRDAPVFGVDFNPQIVAEKRRRASELPSTTTSSGNTETAITKSTQKELDSFIIDHDPMSGIYSGSAVTSTSGAPTDSSIQSYLVNSGNEEGNIIEGGKDVNNNRETKKETISSGQETNGVAYDDYLGLSIQAITASNNNELMTTRDVWKS